jgi:hypothetical protein
MEVSGQLHAQVALLPRRKPPATNFISGWVNPRAGLDVAELRKILSLPGKKKRFSSPQPVAIPTEIFRLIMRK